MRRMWDVALVTVVAFASLAAPLRADVCQPCETEVEDAKMHGRSLKSYWGVATATTPPDPTVLEKALEQGHLALCGRPDHWEWNMFMGMISAELGKYELSGCYFKEALKYAESRKDREKVANNRGHFFVDHYNQALTLYKSEAYDAAIEQLDIAIAIAPDSCKAHGIKGSALINLARYEDAATTLEKGIETCPEDQTLKDNLFGALNGHGNELYDQAIAVTDDTTGQQERLYTEAVDWYTRAQAIRPDHLGNLFQKGLTCLYLVRGGDTEHLDEARSCLTRFVELAESKDDLQAGYYNLAVLEVEAGDLAKAKEYADSYFAAKPDDSSVYQRLAVLSQQMGDTERAQLYIILYSAYAKGEQVPDVNAWLKSHSYDPSSDLVKMVKAKGAPEEFHSYEDSSGNNMDAAFYWSKGEGYAFYAGQERGSVSFPPQEPEPAPGSEPAEGNSP